MSGPKRKRKPITLPKTDKDASVAKKEAAEWVAGSLGSGSTGVYQDPDNPARFVRKGRGGRPKRTVRRLTVYVADELATALDVHIARSGKQVSRSDVVEAALRAFLNE